jgi:hypothetical protein
VARCLSDWLDLHLLLPARHPERRGFFTRDCDDSVRANVDQPAATVKTFETPSGARNLNMAGATGFGLAVG